MVEASGMNPPLYPARSLVRAGECGRQPIKDLETWVKGGTFHRYGGEPSWHPQDGETWEDAHDRLKYSPSMLKIEGALDHYGHVSYWIWYARAGDGEARGGGGSYMTPEDGAYSCLTRIEEHERKLYEENLVIGLA